MPLQIPVTQTGLEASIQQAMKNAGRNAQINLGTNARQINALKQPLGRITGQADEFTNGQATYLHRTNNIRSFRLSEVVGYVNVYNTLHHIRIRVSMDNYATFGPWGESCWAKTPIAIMENEPTFVSSESENMKLTIYPNPSDNNFSLKFTDEDLIESVNIKLYDFNNRLVFEKYLNDFEINDFNFGEDISHGFYQLVIENNKGEIENFKLLKSK